MSQTDLRERRLRNVAARAMHGYDALTPPERIELLLALAEMLPAADAEAARHAAFVLQEAETHQLKFAGLLGLRAA